MTIIIDFVKDVIARASCNDVIATIAMIIIIIFIIFTFINLRMRCKA